MTQQHHYLGEPILRALHREVREEIGIDVTVEALVDIFEHLTPGPSPSRSK